MVEFVMEFSNVELGRSAAQFLIRQGYPAAYFIHEYITGDLRFGEYGTIEMVVPEDTLFM
jgi:hypothetical protein